MFNHNKIITEAINACERYEKSFIANPDNVGVESVFGSSFLNIEDRRPDCTNESSPVTKYKINYLGNSVRCDSLSTVINTLNLIQLANSKTKSLVFYWREFQNTKIYKLFGDLISEVIYLVPNLKQFGLKEMAENWKKRYWYK